MDEEADEDEREDEEFDEDDLLIADSLEAFLFGVVWAYCFFVVLGLFQVDVFALFRVEGGEEALYVGGEGLYFGLGDIEEEREDVLSLVVDLADEVEDDDADD